MAEVDGWTEADIDDLSGRSVLVTGAGSGLGRHTALVLAARGARVLLGCRTAAAADAVRNAAAARLTPEWVPLDLTDLAAVRRAAEQVRALGPLDTLVNCAGVMATPYRRTVDGFELQMGTNHFGHAALTWLLTPDLARSDTPRVVTVSSQAHRWKGFDLDDLDFTRRPYRPNAAYAASKAANLLFAFELDRRARAAGSPLLSIAVHPGVAPTDLARKAALQGGRSTRWTGVATSVARVLFGPVEAGAAPILHAATATVEGGAYLGRDGLGGMRGRHPAPAPATPLVRDPELGGRMWRVTADRIGIAPPFGDHDHDHVGAEHGSAG